MKDSTGPVAKCTRRKRGGVQLIRPLGNIASSCLQFIAIGFDLLTFKILCGAILTLVFVEITLHEKRWHFLATKVIRTLNNTKITGVKMLSI